jgi:hypothetical protein
MKNEIQIYRIFLCILIALLVIVSYKYYKLKMEFETEIEQAEVVISFDFQPEEAMVRYYSDGSGYPGCPASIDNVGVYWKTRKFNSNTHKWEDVEIDVTDLMEELGHDIEQLCWDYLEEQND